MDDHARSAASAHGDAAGLALYVAVTYGAMWLLTRLPALLDVPLVLDHRHLGGWLYLVGTPAPLLGAVVATAALEGPGGPRRLFRRSLARRFSSVWALVAVAVPFAVLGVGTALAVAGYGARVPPRWFVPHFGTSLAGVAFFAVFLLDNALGEEIGWRGYALPRLQHALGALGAAVVLGVVWALWHLPLFRLPGTMQYGASLPVFVYLLTCWTVVMTALVNRAHGSVVPAMLFHESTNFIAFTTHLPQAHGLWLWGAAAMLALPLLPRPWLRLPGRAATPPDASRSA